MSVEIIRLLKELVKTANETTKILKENNELLKKNQELIKQTLEKPDSENIEVFTDAIKNSVESLQKGVQVLQLHRALQDVRQMMGTISVSEVKTSTKRTTQGAQPTQNSQPGTVSSPPQTQSTSTSSDDEDNLLKPSDLFE